MTIKIGRAAVGQKFYSTDGEHVYTVLHYVAKGERYSFRNNSKDHLAKLEPFYVVDSRYADKEVRVARSEYMRGAKKYLARHPLPV